MASPAAERVRATVAKNIDLAIIRSGLTNRKVGEPMDASEHSVWRWRRGIVKPSLENLIALADVLGVDDFLWFYEDRDEVAA